jgi:hypothetical protein
MAFYVAVFIFVAQPAPDVLVKRLEGQATTFENVVLEGTWTELSNGIVSRWEEQKIYSDSLGRYRMWTQGGRYNNGTRDRDANAPDELERVYDGEKTATISYFRNKDRLGKAATTALQGPGYRTAQVHDGTFPPRGIVDYRNPLTIVVGEVIAGLKECIAAGREASLAATEDDRDLFRLVLSRDGRNEAVHGARMVALLDSTKGWLPVHVDAVDPKGRVLRRSTCDYDATARGLWAPRHGSLKHYGTRQLGETPVWEWRFDVKKVVLNNPSFDETVFNITLSPDTAVSDIRYGVTYRVGDDEVLGNQLTALAERARQERNESAAGAPEQQLSTGRTVFLVANILLVLVLNQARPKRRRYQQR